MKKIAFLIPTYPPHFGNTLKLYNSYINMEFDLQSDFWLVFTNEEEKKLFDKFYNTRNFIIYDSNLGTDRDGIINKKKFYGINYLKDKYKYIIVLDSESLFIKNINLLNMCDSYFNKKVLYGNTPNEEAIEYVNIVRNNCKRFFYDLQYKLDTHLYLWFNQPCIYKSSTIENFFEIIDYKNNISTLKFIDYDYYIYMYYLIIYHNFQIIDIEITSILGACQNVIPSIVFHSHKYKKINLYMCSKYMFDYFNNDMLFLLIQLDKVFDSQVLSVREDLFNKINILENKINTLENNINSIKYDIEVYNNFINSIAWWIPIKKWRNNFRGKFIIRPDQTRPDQTRPDQTRPDQTINYNICSDYICFYNNTQYKKIQPILQDKIAV